MVYSQGYQPHIALESPGQNAYGNGQGGMGGYGGGTYNMGVESPYSPPNNGGSGNPGTANNMPKPLLPRFQQFQNNKGPAPLTPQDRARYDQATQQRMGGNGGINPGNMYNMIGYLQRQGRNQMQQGDPFNRYGYAGQSPQLGRYVPPMMGNANDLNSWQGGGGYAYNIPNSYGSGQWNQFNSRDVAFPQFGQSQNVDPRTGSVRAQLMWPNQQPPSYQSPFGRPDPMRQQNYIAYMMSLAQGQQPVGNNPTQPGAPDQPGPVT